MKINSKKAKSTGLIAAGITAGAIFAPLGFATAQDDLPETDGDTTEAPAVENDLRHKPRANRGAKAQEAAEILGITTDELRAELQAGNTLAEIAQANGVSESDLIARLVAAASAHIDEAVDAGRLTADEGAEKKANLEERITAAVNADPADRPGGGHRPGGRHGGPFGDRGDKAEALGEALGLTTEELRSGFEAGKSIADMAVEQGVDVDALVDQLVAEATARVDQAVADGKIDSDKAAQITEDLQARITERVNQDPSERPERPERGFRGPRGPEADSDGETTESGLDA